MAAAWTASDGIVRQTRPVDATLEEIAARARRHQERRREAGGRVGLDVLRHRQRRGAEGRAEDQRDLQVAPEVVGGARDVVGLVAHDERERAPVAAGVRGGQALAEVVRGEAEAVVERAPDVRVRPPERQQGADEHDVVALVVAGDGPGAVLRGHLHARRVALAADPVGALVIGQAVLRRRARRDRRDVDDDVGGRGPVVALPGLVDHAGALLARGAGEPRAVAVRRALRGGLVDDQRAAGGDERARDERGPRAPRRVSPPDPRHRIEGTTASGSTTSTRPRANRSTRAQPAPPSDRGGRPPSSASGPPSCRRRP